jgi:hypothetical protein
MLIEYANESARAARDSGNATFEDLAVASSLYIQAYIAAGDSYTSSDSWLIYTGFRIANLVSGACRAVSG